MVAKKLNNKKTPNPEVNQRKYIYAFLISSVTFCVVNIITWHFIILKILTFLIVVVNSANRFSFSDGTTQKTILLCFPLQESA